MYTPATLKHYKCTGNWYFMRCQLSSYFKLTQACYVQNINSPVSPSVTNGNTYVEVQESESCILWNACFFTFWALFSQPFPPLSLLHHFCFSVQHLRAIPLILLGAWKQKTLTRIDYAITGNRLIAYIKTDKIRFQFTYLKVTTN